MCEPDRNLFLAVYAPYIREPYKFNFFPWRDYKDFLIPEDEYYTIGLFPNLDMERIFNLYLQTLKPSTLEEYTLLCYFCNHMYLNIPKEFQEKIEEIILEGEKFKT